MIYNTTYRNDHDIYLINKAVGQPYSLWQRLKMGGIGSKRMSIQAFSPGLSECRSLVQDLQFGLLELRPKGILVLINKQGQNFTWPIPFAGLELTMDTKLRVGALGEYVVFGEGAQENEGFLRRVQESG